jgi:MFS family permease
LEDFGESRLFPRRFLFLIPFQPQTVSLIFIGFAVGSPFFGWLSDRLGRRHVVMLWGTILASIAITAAIYMPGVSPSTLFLSHVFLWIFHQQLFALLHDDREINLPMLAATAIGFMNAFDAVLGAFFRSFNRNDLGFRMDGKIVDGARVFSVASYKAAFLTLPAYLILSVLTLLKIKETYCKAAYPTTLP